MTAISSSWPKPVRDTIHKLKAVTRDLKLRFTARDEAIDLLALGTVCQEQVLLVGPPGTAKTQLISHYTQLIAARGFHYLLTRFTEPTELFGPVDLEKFKTGLYQVRTEGMLPDAQVVFLDEVFRGSSPILNSLLTILNERMFFNGPRQQVVPLVLLVGATNDIPDDPSLQALADRFVLRCELEPVADNKIDNLLELGWELERDAIESRMRSVEERMPCREAATVHVDEVVKLHGHLREVDLSAVRTDYAQVLRELRAQGVWISDRRAVKGLKLIAGHALLRETSIAEIQDFKPLEHIWSRPDEVRQIQEVIQPRIAEAGGPSEDPVRPPEDILRDLETLVAQPPRQRSEAAAGAYLMALNRLRRELIHDHPADAEARKKVEQAIRQFLEIMEKSHV